jgi:hypothetical protein
MCIQPKKKIEILQEIKIADNYRSYTKYIKPLLIEGMLEYTLPDKLSSKYQQYQTTLKGKAKVAQKGQK